jgi:hypothetical protein
MTTIARRLRTTRTAVRYTVLDLADFLALSSSWVITYFSYLTDEYIAATILLVKVVLFINDTATAGYIIWLLA